MRDHEDHQSGDDWLLTYSDMVTLLMTFFIVMLAASTTNSAKYEKVAQSMSSAFKGKSVSKVESQQASLQKNLNQIMTNPELKGLVTIKTTEDGVSIVFAEGVLFTSGSAKLEPDAYALLKKVAGNLRQTSYGLSVEGHTDNVAIRSSLYPSNWELSSSRASEVVKFLIKEGMPPGRLKAVGYADTRPLLPNHDKLNNPIARNQAKNRRVVISVHY